MPVAGENFKDFLKASHLLIPKLTKYFNNFIGKGVFPKILKIGRVTPIFQKGDAQLFGNYRPVCTLPIFGFFGKRHIQQAL